MTMEAIWYFDFISPFSYLQLPKILALRERVSITPRPIVFGAVLKHHGQLGPAEIAGKREFTYRIAQWRAETEGIALRFPPAHPFNSISALRLAIACGSSWEAIRAIFDHLWKEGRAGDTPENLDVLVKAFGFYDGFAAISAAAVKEELRANTEEAIAGGIFGVPSVRVGTQVFWGDDATPMLEDFLADPQRFDHGEYARIVDLPTAIERQR
jgi:2-hydroxychromene-2-carboxylate isomerase